MVDSSSEQMRGQIEEAARGAAEKGLQAWQTRLQEIADKTLAASSDQIRARVEESAQAMADKALQAWQVRLQEVADGAAASSSDQVRGQINEALSLMGPKLQEMQERAVNDAVEAFRGRLSQFLGLLPSGGNQVIPPPGPSKFALTGTSHYGFGRAGLPPLFPRPSRQDVGRGCGASYVKLCRYV